ncbi:MAG: PD-(D/E)XK nuclease family protein, partial [Mogibacterium sp.]|nr:PD-(D/E)XK nuclease family protein [Mogibacterium sp.]
GIEVSCDEIRSLRQTGETGSEESYVIRKSETIERIEKYLWREIDPENQEGDAYNRTFIPEDLTLVCAANPYYEAENAAAYIWHLVRDLGYKMSDIQVIANDEGGMQPIIRRVFAEYGLPVFSDAVRSITDTAAVAFMVNLLRFEQYNRAPQYIFAMLKSGMTDFADEDVEALENYVKNYRIRGSMWDRDFKYGEDQVGEETFARLNEMRSVISDAMKELAFISKKTKVSEFAENFKSYLENTWKLAEKVNEAAALAAEDGFSDEAQRLVQSYEKAIEMLFQMREIMGDDELRLEEFTEIYVAGLLDVEVGVIPDVADGLAVGTMIRTRPRPMKAAVILGANEGVLPLQPSTEGLFSNDEKDFFKKRGFALGELDDVRVNEENAAMYRMMSAPSEKLYISYSMTDTGGNDASPSPLLDSLTELFPQIEEKRLMKKDIISEGWGIDMVQTADDALRHLAVHIKESVIRDNDEDLTLAMLKWYRENRKSDLDVMIAASEYDNEMKPLGAKLASKLYKKNRSSLKLSASSIGNYFDCPFKYFVNNGLGPQEERDFAADPRTIGDAYHECLMAVAGKLVGDKELLGAINSGDDDALERLVSEELAALASEYRGGLFISSGTEKFRMERIKEICGKAAKAMATQLGAESVTSASLEENFGRGGVFEPIKIKVGDEEVYVEGKIDRADVLRVAGGERVRIIDYKTGADSLDLWKMRQGYHMQLMIYLISASSGDYEPAGMFYFNIKDPIQSANDAKKDGIETIMEKAPEDMFKLKGAFLNEEGVLSAMPEAVLASSGKGSGISREDFEVVRADVMSRMKEAASGILNGDIGIHPLRETSNTLACRWCSYASVCRRSGDYPGNYSKKLKPKPKDNEKEKDKDNKGAWQLPL